jgi:hypothetical protein
VRNWFSKRVQLPSRSRHGGERFDLKLLTDSSADTGVAWKDLLVLLAACCSKVCAGHGSPAAGSVSASFVTCLLETVFARHHFGKQRAIPAGTALLGFHIAGHMPDAPLKQRSGGSDKDFPTLLLHSSYALYLFAYLFIHLMLFIYLVCYSFILCSSLQEEILGIAAKVYLSGHSLLVIDTENKFVSTGFAKEIARVAQGQISAPCLVFF